MFSRRESDRDRRLTDYSAITSATSDYLSDSDSDFLTYGTGRGQASHSSVRDLQGGRRKKQPSTFVLCLCLLGSFINGFFLNVRGPCIGDLATRSGVTRAQVGYFFIASGIGGIAASLPAGKLIDWIGNPMVPFAIGLFLRAASCFALPYASSLWLLVLTGIVQGLTLPMVGVSLRAAVLWMYEEEATPKLNFVMAAFGAGSTIAPLVYDGFAELGNGSSAPLDWTFWGLAAVSALIGGSALCADRRLFFTLGRPTMKTPLSDHNAGNANGASETEVDSSSQGYISEATASASAPIVSQSDRMVFLTILNAYMMVSVGIEGTLGSWLYTLAGGNGTQGFSEATWINTALWGSFTLSRIFLVLVTTFKQEHVLYASHALCFFGTLYGLLTFQRDTNGGRPGLPSLSLWALTISFGIGIAPSFPNVIGLANRLYPGTFSGLVQSIFGISATCFHWVG